MKVIHVFPALAAATIVVGAAASLLGSSSSHPRLPAIPGGVNPLVTQANIASTVCRRGWTRTVRPPLAYTAALKRKLFRDGRLPGRLSDYQLDHLVSLELGGASESPENLWMQPWSQAARDDRMENQWNDEVCSGRITLEQGRAREIRWKHRHG